MGCRPIVLGPNRVHVLRNPSRGSPAGLARARVRNSSGRFESAAATPARFEVEAPNASR